MVEGASNKRSDFFCHSIGVLQEIGCFHSGNLPAIIDHKLIAVTIIIKLPRLCMDLAVDFDNEPRGETAEISNVRTDRMLPAEFGAGRRPAEPLP